jgi:hypothetical protein
VGLSVRKAEGGARVAACLTYGCQKGIFCDDGRPMVANDRRGGNVVGITPNRSMLYKAPLFSSCSRGPASPAVQLDRYA